MRKLNLSQKSKHEAKKINLKKLSFIGIPILSAIVAFTVIFGSIFFNKQIKVYADNLMKEITPQKVKAVDLDEKFIKSTADFSVELFQKAYKKGENSLVSPTSVFLALGMTANGADSNTLKEFESLLGKRGINMNDLNAYYNSLSKKLTSVESGKVNIANSIWYRKDKNLNVKKEFLQTNADYYNASAYSADFTSEQTAKDINNWVKNNTGNLIDKIIDNINPNTIMYLINAVYFEDQWKVPYQKSDIRNNNFKLSDGSTISSDFMYSNENSFIKDDIAQGFIKPYKNGKYSFVALLPNEGVNIDSYITSLTGEKFVNLINNKSKEAVSAAIPMFKAEYTAKLVEPLMQMELKECFDSEKADFSKMAAINSGNIYIDDVLHKTFITVDDQGTKAGAVTKVEMKAAGAMISHKVILDRPFVYAIVDNETNLPLFLGTMMKPEI